MDMLEFIPSTETLRLQLETLVFNGLSAVTNRERLLRNSMFKVYVEASLDDGAQGGDGDDDGGELSSENMDLDILIMEDVTFVETLQNINSIVLDAYELAEENCGELSIFLERYQENTRFRKDVSDPSRYLGTDVHDFRELLDKYIQEAQDVDTVAETASCGLLLLDRTELNSLLKPSPRKCLDGLYKLIPVVFRLLNDNLTKELTTTNDRISTIPTTVEEFSESLAFLRELQAGHDEIEERYRCVRSLYHLLEEYRVKMTDTDQMNAFVLTQKKSQLKASMELFEGCCEQYSAKFGIELEARLPGLVSKLTTVSNALSNSPLFDLKSNINDIIGYLTRVEADIIQLETEVKLHFQYEKTLGLPQSTAFEELDDLKADLALKIDMWKMFQEWRGVVSVWEKQRFPEEIDFTTIVDRVEHFYNQITQWEQRLSEGMGPLCVHLKSCVEEYRVTMPILTDLRCPSFEERHYYQLRELLGFGIRHLGSSRTSMNAPVLTLGELVQMHLSPFGSQINRIATEAAQERLLKDMLSKIIVLWERLEFDVKPHKESKEYYVLASLEAIYTTLEESLTICSQLSNLTRLVRTSLTPLQRRVVVSLVTTDVHFRDIVESLVAKRVTDENDFLWEQQLRYQWYAESDECEIQQANCRIKYGYEYMGACSRLVITPLTDRCWMTITGALELRYGAAPSGPAGTGKTETSKDLAKALGILCIVINCSSQMSCKMMGSILNGVIQAGTWVCLDEFNRIDIEVLSVVGQQMSVLRNARLMDSTDVLLDGQCVPLREHHVIITMNPGYVGRTELPDNLKVSFRPVAMMVPDYALIAEILLFAEGFQLAKPLSRKVTKLFKLCSEQLSQQAHYDFGMRAVRTVLTMAGSLKRSAAASSVNAPGATTTNGAAPDSANISDENVVLIKAMVGANTPKLTEEDNRLFQGIVKDLFPDTLTSLGAVESEDLLQGVGVFTPSTASGGVNWMTVLENEIYEQLRDDGLQSSRQWMKKILQLFATLEVRVGVVQIGSTGSGKSTALKMLKAAVTALRDRVAHPDTRFQRVVSFTLNPKALSMVELYGFFHPVTHEWTDGLASKLLRTCIMEKNEEMLARHYANQAVGVNSDSSTWNLPFYWITFDGPIDVHWIESMNTVLDDNMTLCLANGERIKLLPKIQLLFEVADTSAASPATISRLADIDPSDFDADSLLSVIAHGKVLPLVLNLSAQTSSDSAQLCIESKFAKKRRTLLGAPVNKQLVVVYVDDVNMPSIEQHGAQPVIELLRQYLEFEGFYDREKFFWKDVKDSVLIAAGGLPGGGRQPLCPRFVRHFSAVFCLPSCNESAMKTIFNSILAAHIAACGGSAVFAKNVKDTLLQTADATCELFQRVVQGLLPTPSKCHYTFNLRDVTKLMQGIVLGTRGFTGSTNHNKSGGAPQTSSLTANTVVNLWAHEGIRVFRDRLMDDTDRTWFSEQLVETANSNFGLAWTINNVFVTESSMEYNQLQPGDDNGSPAKAGKTRLLFSPIRVSKGNGSTANSSNTVIKYDQVGDLGRYEAFLNGQIAAYNTSPLSNSTYRPPLNLVLFEDAMVHTAATARILVQPRGHAMLLGMGGCGKRSLARLAAFMTGYRCFEIEMKKDYNIEDFREDLKCMMKLAALGEISGGYTKSTRGKSGRSTRTLNVNATGGGSNPGSAVPTVFLINDSQLVCDAFLEDINTILNGGDIPKLFASDELERIINDVRTLLERITGELKASQASHGNPAETSDMGDFTRKDCEDYFHSMVQNSLHFVICMNPLGEVFRARVRQFPALINCTTIDYFDEWPKSALEYVAEFYLSQEISEDRSQGMPVLSRGSSTPDLSSSPVIRSALTTLCVEAHQSINAVLPTFFANCRRRVYITSQHYLDLISLFRRIYQEKKARWETKLHRLMAGVVKLEETNSLVTTLQDELVTLQPVLTSKTKEAEGLLAQVAIDQTEAEQVAKRVGADEAVVKEQQQEVAACQMDAQRDLDQALPALNAAVAALDSLDKKDITEVKGFVKPPQAVQFVMEAVCIMLGEKADWDNSKRILSRGTFMAELKEYDKDNIPVAILKKIRKYIENPEFAVEEVKKVSHAAMSLCMWVHAIDTYARVFREVAPKRQRLAEMNLVLGSANAKLATKQQELSNVLEKVRKLKGKCDATLAEKQRLLEESDLTQQRLKNAEKLTVGLHDERIRWKGSIKLLKKEGNSILGDSFLTAACMSYLGPFDGLYRCRLLQRWTEHTISSIGASTSFVLADAYGDVRELREWQLLGLPSDSFSTDNAICVLKSKKRWALMIDPQQQAIQWIKRLEALYHLETVKSDDNCLMQVVEECLVGGKPLLIEDVIETLDPSLEPVLAVKPSQRSCYTNKFFNKVQVKLEDRIVETDVERFRLYLTTKLANPLFMPDVFIRVNVVNFTVTRDGLEEQLLSDVVLRERMEVEERKHTLLASIARDQQQLQDIEIKILNLLSDAKGNILDDIELIQALETSKQTSIVVAQRLTESEATKLEVLEIRNQYHSVAVRGAILFFVIADLVEVDPMYQYSLEYFTRLFNLSLNEAPAKRNLSERLDSLKRYMTVAIYRNICRGLFKSHKKLFAFVICVRILINAGDLNPLHIRLFDQSVVNPEMTSASGVEQISSRRSTNARVESLGDTKEVKGRPSTMDTLFLTLSKSLPVFTKILESYYNDNDAWCTWIASENPFVSHLPGDWDATLPRFLRLVIVRWLREDAFTMAVRCFVEENLGAEFLAEVDSDVSMDDVYCDVDKSTPCLFILSPGADPISALERYAREKGLGEDRYHVISLGQGQGPIVELKMEECKQQGFWLVLQNVHLAKSWLPKLQSQLATLKQEVRSGSVHEGFRLFLASFPVAYLPISILQNSVKVMTESPMGVKANLQRSMLLIKQLNADLDKRSALVSTSSNKTMKLRLAFGLSFFHAVVRERSKFGTLGWNLKYDFSDADFVSVVTLQRRLLDAVAALDNKYNTQNSDDRQEIDAYDTDRAEGGGESTKHVPWDALLFLAGEIYYGGRVTDEFDRRCLTAVLRRFCSETCFTASARTFRRESIHGIAKAYTKVKSSSTLQSSVFSTVDGSFFAPEFQSEDEMVRFVDALPDMDGPHVFGMHPNAHISYQRQVGQEFVKLVLQLQPSQANVGDTSIDDAATKNLSSEVSDNKYTAGNHHVELTAFEISKDIQAQLPPQSTIETAESFLSKRQLEKYQDPLIVVLEQELMSCHTLVNHINHSLGEVRHAIQGVVVMSVKIEQTLHSLTLLQVPVDWIAYDTHSIPTTKSLSQWVTSLLHRCEFLYRWAERGRPPHNAFPLSVFSFPQGLFTAILQRHARKHSIPIHFLDFQFRVLSEHESSSFVETTDGQQSVDSGAEGSDEGAYLTGLFLEEDASYTCTTPPQFRIGCNCVSRCRKVISTECWS
ncbi:Dynein heavy chain 6, axonemal [Phytophthora fragariae]|uniref:Dynein heavy chain 6, axonemal n=3 Tax=Phytophthora fragariae TaxID=53985 RepID=A0A6G0KRB6_9STRA|nr:Dynein heavy chain 6, axonemal [Phytophthora fragariae]